MIRTEKVVIFTPPPVEPGAAPMNISMVEMPLLMGLRVAWSMELNPAVRQVTDWNRPAVIFSPKLRPDMVLFHS